MASTASLAQLWPASAVRVTAGDLELRWIDDELLVELADLAARGVHSADAMPFEHPWTEGTPKEVARSVLAYQWNARANVGPGKFVLELAVIHDGGPVGIQGLVSDDWSVLGRVKSGSWLGLEHQGHGIGTRMRMLALHLAFDSLGALEATSGAFADNGPSNAVSQRVGYTLTDARRVARAGKPTLHNDYSMSREQWKTLRTQHAGILGAPVVVAGIEEFAAVIGAAGSPDPTLP